MVDILPIMRDVIFGKRKGRIYGTRNNVLLYVVKDEKEVWTIPYENIEGQEYDLFGTNPRGKEEKLMDLLDEYLLQQTEGKT